MSVMDKSRKKGQDSNRNEITNKRKSNNKEGDISKKVKYEKYADLNEMTWIWFMRNQCNEETITAELLTKKAQEYAIQLGQEEFRGSLKWLTRFLKNHNIMRSIHGKLMMSSEAGNSQNRSVINLNSDSDDNDSSTSNVKTPNSNVDVVKTKIVSPKKVIDVPKSEINPTKSLINVPKTVNDIPKVVINESNTNVDVTNSKDNMINLEAHEPSTDLIDDEPFTIEERVYGSIWIHEMKDLKKTIRQVKLAFQSKFNRQAPSTQVLLNWEYRLFKTGSVMSK